MRFSSEQVNAASGAVDPIYLSETYLYRDFDHDRNGMKIEVPKIFSFIFPKEDGKDSEMQFAASGLAKPNIGNTNYDFDKESEVLIDYNRCNDNIIELSIQCRSMSIVQPCWVKISVAGITVALFEIFSNMRFTCEHSPYAGPSGGEIGAERGGKWRKGGVEWRS